MYSQMQHRRRLPQTNQGGISASGLGGLLVGGARRTPEELKAYHLALHPYRVSARANLQHLAEAESWATEEARRQNLPYYEEPLNREYLQELKILGRKRQPKWATNQYNYHLYEKHARAPMTDFQKQKMADERLAKKLSRQENGTLKVINPDTKRSVYVDSAKGRSIISQQNETKSHVFEALRANRENARVHPFIGYDAPAFIRPSSSSSSSLLSSPAMFYTRGMNPNSRANLSHAPSHNAWAYNMANLADEEELRNRGIVSLL